jgi:predicted ATP-dependent serine protease
MVIIHGEQETGKSTLALNILKNKKNSLYLILENDLSVIRKFKKNNVDFTYIKYCHLMDLKYQILEYGGLMNNTLDYVVIDSINFIKDNISYKEKINYIKQLELDFKINILLIFNTLSNLDKLKKIVNSIECDKKIDIMLIKKTLLD